jgi:hypothetical protein
MSEAGILKNMIGIECPSIDEILNKNDYPLGAVFADKNELKYLAFKGRSSSEVMKIKSVYSENSIGILCENSGEIYYEINNHGILMPLFGDSYAVNLCSTDDWLLSAGTADGTFLYATDKGIFRVGDGKTLIGKEELKKQSIEKIIEIRETENGAYCLLMMKNHRDVIMRQLHYENETLSFEDEIFRHTIKKYGNKMVSSAVVLEPTKSSSGKNIIACLTNGQFFLNDREITLGKYANLGFNSVYDVNSISLLHRDNETADILMNALHYFARLTISLKNAEIVFAERIELEKNPNVYAAIPIKNREMHEKILELRC